MVKLNNQAFNQPNSQQNSFNQNSQFTDNQSQNQSQFTEQSQQTQPPTQKGLFQIPEKFLQLIPWIPVGLEMLTGQKIPPVGVLADILSGVQQLQFTQQQILNRQQQLWTKLESLENNASQQFTNLISQVQNIQSLRLTHSKEHKAIEYNNPNPRLPTEEETY
ncbi:hypothetical protein [endosymbiont GvMRE of Glomus versiforme]|uniref:hypothetical protein n=1 Tax=endosymbiont GvMRE of Glomus versiforme TaxID=2039283 RepID=UPI000ED0E688|nr:hypothetical protein [endosymbiont GvMRE of Glomus versiforme]RHZ36680.1 hypothetical protein GvMRE_I2g409 [endosymbiont GvMRE of Glomus versiforme]